MRNILLVEGGNVCNTVFRKIIGDKASLTCAGSGEEGLEALVSSTPYQVVIADYVLPGMRGTEFLAKARELFPGVVRILICGNKNYNVAVNAINECGVFRFLPKPCSASVMRKALRDAFEYHRCLNYGQEMMDKSVGSVIRLVSDVASLLKPERNARTTRMLPTIKSLSRKLGDPDPWSTEIAAVLSMIGFVFLPEPLLEKVEEGTVLKGYDYEVYVQHTRYSSKLISGVPRLESVATILSLQEAHYLQDVGDGKVAGDEIPLGARILKVVSDYDRLSMGDRSKGEVIAMLKRRPERYDPGVITCLVDFLGRDACYYVREVYPLGLEAGMTIAEDVFGTVKGRKVKFISKGQVLTDSNIDYIYKNGENILDITRKIKVRESHGPDDLSIAGEV
ncbi:HD domain-containing phosphohydrolase [Maridesulfovibrio sp. FT414]|uniref:HD domain-containing phosphohydrolase n=1 Tax=Maridesulfovibrio sp. FT414 TaxID=2979469 RepID=UPI003D80117C